MAGREDLCNEALGLLGENPITDIDATETKAIRCKQFWETTRDACLRAHPWNFATKRVALVQNVTAPAFGYTYSYAVPSNCLRLLAVTDGTEDLDSSDIQDTGIEYKLEGDDILCNSEALYAKFIEGYADLDSEETGMWDALFCSYFAAELAAKIGAGLTKSATIVNSMIQLANVRLQYAKAVDAKESGSPAVQSQSSWITARGC